MNDIFIKHKIQRYILESLARVESLRFRDLRPLKTETNLLTYHLKIMISRGIVDKQDNQYFLTQKGVNTYKLLTKKSSEIISSPDMVIMLVVQNSNGDLLLQKTSEQPYSELWSLPRGLIASSDKDIKASVARVSKQNLKLSKQESVHAGNAYTKVLHSGRVISYELVHVFKFNKDEVVTNEKTIWVRPHELHKYGLAPGVSEVIARTFFNDPFFFEEFEVNLYN